ncbi:hypothetical protein [Arachnia propionica]|uniref:hypothetical protein n=1 Tax=Arachnia propionica TaxID=1750 RepID=UPI000F6C983F|nr:hypothetical protein [Arachnia propionica]VEJ59568.1 Uncharacterised protein [Arachnia propionica]
MQPEIIVMLTHNDVTVPDARACFADAADLPITYWGFKDNGLNPSEMKLLVEDFRQAGKVPVLEAVTFDDEELMRAVSIAIDCGMEYFTGSTFSREVAQRVHAAGLKYFPFCGQVRGPVISLTGAPSDVVADAVEQLRLGADGVDLVAYRYKTGDPVALAKELVHKVGEKRVVIAGSINSRERMEMMEEIGPFGFTIGGALFEGAFRPGRSFGENLTKVVAIQNELRGAAK